MNEESGLPRGPIFPPWVDKLVRLGAVLAGGGVVYAVFLTVYAASPRTLNVGYMPEQPVAYSHRLHAGELGIDCRYCHNTVEEAAHAAIPPTQTCMNCHSAVRKESDLLTDVRESYAEGTPIAWVRVHDLADYVYFDHRAHVNRGVGCETCHGRVDRMEEVWQVETLSMAWCLDCHRNPERHLRPLSEVTTMGYVPPEDQEVVGKRLREEMNVHPSTDCSTCHR